MKKCCILFLLMACVLVGCSRETNWEFQYGYEHVSEIKFVDMIDEMSYSVIAEVDTSNTSQLFADIGKLAWKRYGTNLSVPRDICILIMYDTGEYDVISYYEPKHYRFEDGVLCAYNTWLCCDYDSFQDLLNKYRVSQ